MNKINFKLFTTVLALALVAGASIFYACKKEETPPIVEDNVKEDYKAYIEELIITTGIDIYEFSKSDKIQACANVNQRIVQETENSLHSKGEFTEEKLEQLETLEAAIQAALAAGDENQVWVLFDAFCTILRTIDGFQFGVNEYRWVTFTYTWDSNLAYAYFEEDVQMAEELFKEIAENYPQFHSLPEETQIEVITYAIFLNLQNTGSKGQSGADCKKAAGETYGLDIVANFVMFEGAMMACGFTGPACGPCIGAAAAGYAVAQGWSYFQYRRAL